MGFGLYIYALALPVIFRRTFFPQESALNETIQHFYAQLKQTLTYKFDYLPLTFNHNVAHQIRCWNVMEGCIDNISIRIYKTAISQYGISATEITSWVSSADINLNHIKVEFRMKTWWSLLCRMSSFGDYLTVLRWFLEFSYFYYINFNVHT